MKVLIFVYNAESGFYSSIKNHVHRVMSPSTYKCKLYKLTYGTMFTRRVWKNFLHNLSYHKVFFHSSEFKKAHPEYAYLESLPAVILYNGGMAI